MTQGNHLSGPKYESHLSTASHAPQPLVSQLIKTIDFSVDGEKKLLLLVLVDVTICYRFVEFSSEVAFDHELLPDRRARGSSNEALCSLAGPQAFSLRPGIGRNHRGTLWLATLPEFDLSIINTACGNDLRPSEK